MMLNGRSMLLALAVAVSLNKPASSLSQQKEQKQVVSPKQQRVVVVGGGLSGLVVGHVLHHHHHHPRYDVLVLEASPRVGGNIKSIPDPRDPSSLLNIGHATHMGFFFNLRQLLRCLNVPEYPVGRGVASRTPGLFGMTSVTNNGSLFRPSLQDIMSLKVWWEAFWFYFYSYRDPKVSLQEFLQKHSFSDTFLNILYWSMATFEFDKEMNEMKEYSVGVARALLITQVFFQFLLSDLFAGVLPGKMQQGLLDDLVQRVAKRQPLSRDLEGFMRNDLGTAPLSSYFTSNYTLAMERLSQGCGHVRKNCAVTKVLHDPDEGSGLTVETTYGEKVQADAVIFTIQPSMIQKILCEDGFIEHRSALQKMKSGAVGVRIVHAQDLPFEYPPVNEAESQPTFTDSNKQPPPPVFGVFDISELSFPSNIERERISKTSEAGWLSIAFPVYRSDERNRHQQWLRDIPCADESVYPWVRALPSFATAREELVKLQGRYGVFFTGHTLTGVNKASELQVTNALNLCKDYFNAAPPWEHFFPVPLLPDCNDEDAFRQVTSPLEAAQLAFKNLVGSFLLVGVAAIAGVESLE